MKNKRRVKLHENFVHGTNVISLTLNVEKITCLNMETFYSLALSNAEC